MNRLQLVQRLRRESKRSGPVITTTIGLTGADADLVNAIDDAWSELQRREHGWDWMRRELYGPTVAGTRGYLASALDSGATDFGRWFPAAREGYAVTAEETAGSPWELRFLHWDVFRQRFELRTHDQAAPQFWSISPDEKLYVGPTPSGAFTIRPCYWIKPEVMEADEDEPSMASEYHLILVWRGLMELASIDAAPEVYARALANYDTIDSDLRVRYGPRIGFAANKL